jgi:hypothetical protein
VSGLRAAALLASNKMCNTKIHLLHLVGILFPHTNDSHIIGGVNVRNAVCLKKPPSNTFHFTGRLQCVSPSFITEVSVTPRSILEVLFSGGSWYLQIL